MDWRPRPPPKPKALPNTTAIPPSTLKDGMKKAPIKAPEFMNPFDWLRLEELDALQSKDGHVEQELRNGTAPANRDLTTSEDIGKGQEPTFPIPAAMKWNPPSPSWKHGKTIAPRFQSTTPSAPATVIRKRMSPSDMLRLAELDILQPKDDSVEQKLKDGPLPAGHNLATVEEISKGQKRTFPNQTTTLRRPVPLPLLALMPPIFR